MNPIRTLRTPVLNSLAKICPGLKGCNDYNVGMAEILGTFEQAVLLAVVRLRADAYGRTILRQVQDGLKRTVSAGSIYTTLDRLETRGLIHSRVADGPPIRGGRPRRYYSVTADGVRALNDAHKVMTDMWENTQWPVRVER
jgi:PadR family transcriptional regulator, regulatory protein PadR